MSDTTVDFDDVLHDDSTLDSCATTGAALLEPSDDEGVEVVQDEWTGARCEKCKAPRVSEIVSICRHCGWYASLGQFVEVDPTWEVHSQPEAQVAPAPQPAHLKVWLSFLPKWSWVIIASVCVLIVESVIALVATPSGSSIRTIWSLGQLTIGIVAAVTCHIFNFVVLATEDSEFGLLDILLRPLKLWMRAVDFLPMRLWVANTTVCGIAAALLSVLVIGGIPYERFWDWGFKEVPKQNLMNAVMEQVQKVEGSGEEDLEQSINDFAGKTGEESDEKPNNEPPKPKQNTDCVILGFQVDLDGRLTSLVLGTVDAGNLVYAGNVTPKLPPDELRELTETLKSMVSPRPLIQIQYEATWVHPKLTCRVGYNERAKNGRLRDVEWDKLLGHIK